MKEGSDQKVTVEERTYMTPIQGSPDKILYIKIENHMNTSSCKEEIQLNTYILNAIKVSSGCNMVENGYMTKWLRKNSSFMKHERGHFKDGIVEIRAWWEGSGCKVQVWGMERMGTCRWWTWKQEGEGKDRHAVKVKLDLKLYSEKQMLKT